MEDGTAASDGYVAQPPHRMPCVAFVLAAEQHDQIVAGTQPRIAMRHDLPFAATQADHQTAVRPAHVTHQLAVRGRAHFHRQFHDAVVDAIGDCRRASLRAHVPFQQLAVDRFRTQQVGDEQRDERDGGDR